VNAEGNRLFLFSLLDFTLVCSIEIIVFSDREEDFKRLNCQVIVLSVDSDF
jgi:alkyl hydroperoxide reductase subunit AhpC